MHARPPALITYDGLPVSSGGAHTLRSKDRRAAWSRMQQFFAGCTTSDGPQHVGLYLSEGAHVSRSFFGEAHHRASSAFGRASRRLAVAGAMEEHEHAWLLATEQIDEALDLLDRLPPIPAHLGRGLLVLRVETSFRLRDPETGGPLPGQGAELYGGQEADWRLPLGECRAYLRLSRRSTCMLFLSLPFADLDDRARCVIRGMQDLLPFTLSPKHWARWQLNAQGTRYYKRRLSLD